MADEGACARRSTTGLGCQTLPAILPQFHVSTPLRMRERVDLALSCPLRAPSVPVASPSRGCPPGRRTQAVYLHSTAKSSMKTCVFTPPHETGISSYWKI